jgi:hypothetical protein
MSSSGRVASLNSASNTGSSTPRAGSSTSFNSDSAAELPALRVLIVEDNLINQKVMM